MDSKRNTDREMGDEPPIAAAAAAAENDISRNIERNSQMRQSQNPLRKMGNITKSQKVLLFLQEQYRIILKHSTQNSASKELNKRMSQILILKENLNLLIKILGTLQKFKDLTIR